VLGEEPEGARQAVDQVGDFNLRREDRRKVLRLLLGQRTVHAAAGLDAQFNDTDEDDGQGERKGQQPGQQ
jgi:hypothetical protein